MSATPRHGTIFPGCGSDPAIAMLTSSLLRCRLPGPQVPNGGRPDPPDDGTRPTTSLRAAAAPRSAGSDSRDALAAKPPSGPNATHEDAAKPPAAKWRRTPSIP